MEKTGNFAEAAVRLSIVLDNLRRDARMRVESDPEMSVAWVIVPLLPVIEGILFFVGFFLAASNFPMTGTPPSSTASNQAILTFFGLFIFLFIAFIATGIVYAIMIFKLAKRRNTHFLRQAILYEDLIAMMRDVSGKRGVDASMQINNLERTMRDARIEETERSATLWAILSFFIPILGWYVFYYLMKDFFKHERREDIFFEDLSRALTFSGVPINLPRRTLPIPDRSFILYLILSIILGGLFNIYWVYVLVSDPNNHFRQQWMVEDTLIAQSSPVLGGPSIPPPSAPPPPSPMPPASPTTFTPPPPSP